MVLLWNHPQDFSTKLKDINVTLLNFREYRSNELQPVLPYVLFIRLVFVSTYPIPQTLLQFDFSRITNQSYIFPEKLCLLNSLKFQMVIYSQNSRSSKSRHSNPQNDVRV